MTIKITLYLISKDEGAIVIVHMIANKHMYRCVCGGGGVCGGVCA